MSRHPSRNAVGRRRVLALAAACTAAPGAVVTALANPGKPSPARDRLSAARFFTLEPFTLPLLENGQVAEQFTLVIAIEIRRERQRDAIVRLTPRLRDSMYRELYRMVTFRREGAPLPEVDDFKDRLYDIARSVAGEEIVVALLVQQAYKRRVR
jgi:hypothetical protein